MNTIKNCSATESLVIFTFQFTFLPRIPLVPHFHKWPINLHFCTRCRMQSINGIKVTFAVMPTRSTSSSTCSPPHLANSHALLELQPSCIMHHVPRLTSHPRSPNSSLKSKFLILRLTSLAPTRQRPRLSSQKVLCPKTGGARHILAES